MSSEVLRLIRSCSIRKEVNMIKRLFRKHLRRDLVTYYGASHPQFEEIFNWVYEAPILEWRIRMDCIHKTIKWLDVKDGYKQRGEIDHIIQLDKAKELLLFLSK